VESGDDGYIQVSQVLKDKQEIAYIFLRSLLSSAASAANSPPA
jgi:hypothetical protein